MIVVEPVPQDSVAMQVLEREAAVNTSPARGVDVCISAELVTDPPGSVVPWVLTVAAPREKRR